MCYKSIVTATAWNKFTRNVPDLYKVLLEDTAEDLNKERKHRVGWRI